MEADPQQLQILKEIAEAIHKNTDQLQVVRSELETQGAIGSQFLHHAIDFFVIALADIAAAFFVLVTFESWNERDKQNRARAELVLGKIGISLPLFVSKLNIMIPQMRNAPQLICETDYTESR